MIFKQLYLTPIFDLPAASRREAAWHRFGMLMLLIVVLLTLLAPPAHAGNTTFLTDKNGNITFPFTPPNRASTLPGSIENMTLIPAPGLPTIASGACGTTTNGAVVAGSTNQSGRITIGAVATTVCTVTFSSPFLAAPKACVVTPGNAAAAASGTAGGFTGAPTTTAFVLTGLALASTVWNYHCL